MATKKSDTHPAPAEPVSVASQLRELLGKATEADVKEIDAEIAVRESELEKLKANRKMLAQAIGLEEPKKPHWTQRKKAEGGGDSPKPVASKPDASGTPDVIEKRRKVARWIKANGAKHLDKVSEGTGISRFGPGALGGVVIHEWFYTAPDGTVSLTEKGERAANELK